jgi:cysteine-rich repeat protein
MEDTTDTDATAGTSMGTATETVTETVTVTAGETETATESADTTAGETEPGAVCGNDELEPGEQCDDGNTMPGDGCDAMCGVEDIPEACGNGRPDAGEDCDDGNNDPGDGCSPICELEDPEACGNGKPDPGEQCDDGNNDPGDGCDETCQDEIPVSCGDGVLDPGEACDDGNADDDDACLPTCTQASCGDSVVWVGHETCDDGNVADGDGCTAECVSELCGNGMLDLAEQCDNAGANGTPGNTCFTTCLLIDVVFTPPLVIDLDTQTRGDGPRGIEVGDFNDDGRLDLATVNQSSADATVLYGFGDGRFWAPHVRVAGTQPHDVELADLDDDGRLDAIAANEGADTVSVFMGSGVAFAPGINYSVQFNGVGFDPRGLAVADIDDDGDLDVIVANQDSNTVSILEGDGAGGLIATASLGTFVGIAGMGPIDVKVADATGDGELDIVTANPTSDDVTLLAGLGMGNFAAAQTFTTRVGAGGDNPEALALVDVNGDGLADAITANPTSDDIVVLVAAGGGFQAPARFFTLAGSDGDGPSGLAVGDVTGDGELDVVTADLNSDDVSVLEGLGGAAFAAAQVYPVDVASPLGQAGDGPRGAGLMDMDGDGDLDVVTSNTLSSDVTVLRNDGTGELAAPMVFESNSGYDGLDPRALALGDVNDDGVPDAVVANQDTPNITVVAGLGEGQLAPSQTTDLSIGTSPRGIALGDVTGDGLLDWVATRQIADQIGRATQGPSGQFFLTNYFVTDGPEGIAVGDIDGDLDLDLVLASYNASAITRMINNGMGSFGSLTSYFGASQPYEVELYDVTGDGVLDAVSASSNQDEVHVHAGTGLGTFAASSAFTTAQSTSGLFPIHVAVADITGDGLLDVLTANADSNDVTLLTNAGGGIYMAPVIIPATFDPGDADTYAVRVGDFDGDGTLDLATANRNRDTISIVFGFGGTSFSAPQEFDVGVQPSQIAVGDFDGDGLDDVATVDFGDDTVTVRLSQGH